MRRALPVRKYPKFLRQSTIVGQSGQLRDTGICIAYCLDLQGPRLEAYPFRHLSWAFHRDQDSELGVEAKEVFPELAVVEGFEV